MLHGALPYSRSAAFYFWIRYFYLFRFASSTSLKIRVSLTTWFSTILTLCGWAFICCSLKGKHIVADIWSLTQMLESTLRLFNATAVPPGNKPIDPRADPKWKKTFQRCWESVWLQVLGLHLDKLVWPGGGRLPWCWCRKPAWQSSGWNPMGSGVARENKGRAFDATPDPRNPHQ